MKHHDVLIVDEGEGYAAMLSNQQLNCVDYFGFADTGIYGSQVLFQIKTIVPENLPITGGVNGL